MFSKIESLVPKAFVWRRLHSLLGLWIVIYLIEHLIVNSQAALWIGNDGAGFVRMVNAIQHLPYLQVIESMFIGIPIVFHGFLGLKYVFQAKSNAYTYSPKQPSLRYERNQAYSWQRLTSWILIVGIGLHVVQMRFIDKPYKLLRDNQYEYLVKLKFDPGLLTLADRLHVEIFQKEVIEKYKKQKIQVISTSFVNSKETGVEAQQDRERMQWILGLSSFHLSEHQVVAAAKNPGTAILLTTRDTFKSPFMDILYTFFVLAAVYHAFNGCWVFLNTWGILLNIRSQRAMVPISYAFMLLFLFLGLAAIWGSYWINLRS